MWEQIFLIQVYEFNKGLTPAALDQLRDWCVSCLCCFVCVSLGNPDHILYIMAQKNTSGTNTKPRLAVKIIGGKQVKQFIEKPQDWVWKQTQIQKPQDVVMYRSEDPLHSLGDFFFVFYTFYSFSFILLAFSVSPYIIKCVMPYICSVSSQIF